MISSWRSARSNRTVSCVQLLDEAGERLNVTIMQGAVVETILEASQTTDLIAMPIDGRHGFLDALRGSTIERVLCQAHCPLLALPA